MTDIDNAIKGVKILIETQIEFGEYCCENDFAGYQNGYFFTNENIKAYLDLVNFEGKDSALSVLAGGDQVFSLISKGITNIDTFDINELQPYLTLGLKKAMILKYSYLEFLEICKKLDDLYTSSEEIISIISGLLHYMEEEYRTFWKAIIDYIYFAQKVIGRPMNIIKLLIRDNRFLDFYYPKTITFLESEEKYNKLKYLLSRANVNFKPVNANNLPNEFKGKYDFILLSNILDYFTNTFGDRWGYDKLKQFETRLEPLLKQNGVIFLHYLFPYHCYDSNFIFSGSTIRANDLEGEEIILFDGSYNKEGIILKR